MREVLFSELAKFDLDLVAAYSKERWPELVGAYFDGLVAACLQLPTMHPVLAQRVPRHPLLRRILWEDHYVVYRETEVQSEIVRILHAKMDPKRHLGP